MELELEQRRLKEELDIKRKMHELIIRNIGAYLLLINTDFKVLKTNYYSLNKEAKNMLPCRVGDLLQCRNAWDASHGCGTHEECGKCLVRHSITMAFQNRKGFTDVESPMRLYTSTDKKKYVDCDVSVSAALVKMDDEDLILLTVKDITRIKKIQNDLVIAKQKAEDANKKKSVFVASISHEIRTPLNAIVGFSDLMKTAVTDEEKEAYYKIIRTNNDMLYRLVNDILDMSKIEAGTLDFKFSNVDVNVVIQELEECFRMRLEEMNSSVKIEILLGQQECSIYTDRERFTQVISNFVSNAVKNTESGSITVGYEVREKEIYFYVKDTGVGISNQNLERVFDYFTKLDEHKQGTGLGLSISQMIIKRLGGEIGVVSEMGHGSTFWFTLPVRPNTVLLKDDLEQAEHLMLQDTEQVKSKPVRKILVVEDLDDNFLLCQAYLEKYYILLRAHNGEEAVSLFLKHSPDLILMDLKMPVMDGYQAADSIRQISKTIPIVAVTAYAFSDDKRTILAHDFNGFLTKPLKKEDLFSMFRLLGV